MSKPPTHNWDQLIRDYKTREGTQEEFCAERGIKAATLSYQLKRRRESSNAQFVPVALEPARGKQEVVLEFPSGLRVKINA